MKPNRRLLNQHRAIAMGLSVVWVAGLCWMAYLWHLGDVGLVDETEPLFAEAARQMTVTGDWVTPMFNGETRFDKPPLIYWLMAIGYQTLGVNEWAARLPSALSAIALVVACFWVLLRFAPIPAHRSSQSELAAPRTGRPLNWVAAWVGAAIAVLHPLTLIWARTGVSDMLLSACMGTSLIAFFTGYAQFEAPSRQRLWYLSFYVMMAFGILAKGPIGAVIPILTIGVFAIYLGNWRKLWREMHLFPGIILTLVISLPWFLLVVMRHGQTYIADFFGYHNLDRFVSVVNRHSAPWYFYFLVVLIGFMPWSTYLPAAIAQLHLQRRRDWQQQPRSQHLGLFAFSWFISILGFFSISVTKLPSYVLPLMPAAALLVALFWSDRLHTQTVNRSLHWTTIAQIGMLVLYTIACWMLPQLLGPDTAAPFMNQDLEKAGLFWGSALIWGIAAVLEVLCWIRRDTLGLWLVNAIAFLIFLGGVLHPLTLIIDTHRQLPLRQIAQIIPTQRQAGEPLLLFGFKKPTLVFYTQQNFGFYWDGHEYLQNWQTQPSRLPALVVLTPDTLKDLRLGDMTLSHQILAIRGNYQLIRILPQMNNKKG
jgi:4-amino-4-deoxy-L-arabinose transferase-like glycosyltransferase